ncbi:thiamine pyrophosphate-dependent dehydrogenase E1 component subunit alpha [Sphingobium sp. EM0848]|uniref:thiamine pyrophosphate-dependent dehydrogenase E1 component subunit alpha n=1 Tax=Sphingobium sp. EM0848 TaxID=2743473 RepID=UPI00159C2AA2|nr:thiamine pyrophosphate-dependent dehydrogenase E1 component subunit alpha [Sphingobium sp. EM0848]
MIQNDQLKHIFAKALLTRLFEARLIKLTAEGFLPPLLHPGAGQEVAQIAALSALNDDDPLLYSHRGVGYMVARGTSLSAMIADMAGRAGGTNNGKGGIMHVVDVPNAVYGESGTLGGGLVLSVGMGMALKRRRSDQVVIHFFGDGASNRGTFHEALNWAAVQKLPCIYVCENNGWAVSVPTSVSTAVENIADRAAGYGIPGEVVDGADPNAVMAAISDAARRARAGEGPSLIEIKAIRLLGHYAADPQDYRADAATVKERDPLVTLRQRVIDLGLLSEAEIDAMTADYEAQVEQAVETVKAAPLIDADQAFADLYA